MNDSTDSQELTCQPMIFNWHWSKVFFGYEITIGTWYFRIEKYTSNLIEHAKRELTAAGFTGRAEDSEDWMSNEVRKNVLELITILSKQGHSGFSVGIICGMFNEHNNSRRR